MKGKLLLLCFTTALTSADCAPTFDANEKLQSRDLARIRNTLKNDYTATTQFSTLKEIDGKAVEDERHNFHFVKAGKHTLTARCFYRQTTTKSYHRVQKLTVDLVKGRSYMLVPKLNQRSGESKPTCDLVFKDVTN